MWHLNTEPLPSRKYVTIRDLERGVDIHVLANQRRAKYYAVKQLNQETQEVIKLVHAAPDLLEACKELIQLADEGAYIDLEDTNSTPISRKLRAAIAKTEG